MNTNPTTLARVAQPAALANSEEARQPLLKSIIQQLILFLCLSLVVAAPFRSSLQSVDFKLWLLIVTGVISLIYVVVWELEAVGRLPTYAKILMAVLAGSALISCFIWQPIHGSLGVFGPVQYRLGLLSLLSCIICGLATQTVSSKKILDWLYAIGLVVALTGPLFDIVRHAGHRLSGPSMQPDIFAAYLGLVFIVGIFKMRQGREWKLVISLVLLAAIILLTQTRAVLLLLTAFTAIAALKWAKQAKIFTVCFLVFGFLLLGSLIRFQRVANVDYLGTSISYRIDLQKEAASSLRHMPFWGYGIGNIRNSALNCVALKSQALLETCREGYGFNSSHNIFLDHFLEIGWLGGSAYASLFVYGLYRQSRYRPPYWQVFSAMALFVMAYYLTNITALEIELLFWVIGIRLVTNDIGGSLAATK